MSRLLGAAILVLTVASPLRAQTPSVRAGDHVRVQSSVVTGEYLVSSVATDAIVVHNSTTVRVPYSAMTALRVKRQSTGRDAAEGAATGALAGAALAITMGVIIGEENGFFGTTSEVIGDVMPQFMASGAVVGLIGRLVFPRERWSNVPLTGQAHLGRAPGGGIRLGYTMPLPPLQSSQ